MEQRSQELQLDAFGARTGAGPYSDGTVPLAPLAQPLNGSRASEILCRRVHSGSRSPKWILNASRAVVQLRVRVHAGTALTMAR